MSGDHMRRGGPSAVAAEDVHPARDDHRPFSILHVCVGNICRSVLAERLTRLAAQRRFGRQANLVQVSSAGTRARPGAPMHPYTAAALQALGAEADRSAARRLTPDLIATADVVLTATATERDDVLSMMPTALNRTFTLREFARLSAHLPPAGPSSPFQPSAVVSTALGLRWRTTTGTSDSDDIADPRRRRAAFHVCAGVIADAVCCTMSALFTADASISPLGQ
jgi:protein-tyrosine phosphatase